MIPPVQQLTCPDRVSPVQSNPVQQIMGPGSDQTLIFGTQTELAWTALDQSIWAESAQIRWELLRYFVNI